MLNLFEALKAGIKNPITTWTGVAIAFVGIGVNLWYMFDGVDTTAPDAESIGLALMGIVVFIQGLVSRDANKTSEDSKR